MTDQLPHDGPQHPLPEPEVPTDDTPGWLTTEVVAADAEGWTATLPDGFPVTVAAGCDDDGQCRFRALVLADGGRVVHGSAPPSAFRFDDPEEDDR